VKRIRTLCTAILLASCAAAPAWAATYFVDPAKGDDANIGTVVGKPWKCFDKLNAQTLGPGDKVVVAPGVHVASLHPKAQGTAGNPAVIEFQPGVHEFAPENALRRPLFVSNSCDAPTIPKPIGILIENCAHLRLQGGGVEGDKKTLLLMGGRMIEAADLQSEDVSYKNLVFDLKRPTVSEFRVLETMPERAVIQVAEGSSYEIKDGKFSWTGDWGSGAVICQQVDLANKHCWRSGGEGSSALSVPARDLGERKVELTFGGNAKNPLVANRQYHFRHPSRDSVGIHNARSKDIVFEDCDIYALTNMGIVSQFTENLTFRRVRVAPPSGTIRTCPAFCDVFHFSNCKGQILVEDCVTSGVQDDPINCHGTHLRIMGKPTEKQLKLRYMHPQTYGFAPYIAGDEIAVVDCRKLRELPGNPRRKVVDCVQSDKEGKEWTITLDGPAPAFGTNDVVDNVTWHPNLTVRRCHVDTDPVRGYLITTRGKVLIENCTFHRCHMPGILVEDDARGWFESTCIRDMTLRGNTFIGCGIEINPQTESNDPNEPVHENIRIVDNVFDGGGISVRGVKGLVITGNKTPAGAKVSVKIAPSCSDVTTD
jgi:hypothetical protein